jgi:hypothetical protein
MPINNEPLVVQESDRIAAADIARIFLGNGDTLPDDLKSGKLARHWLLDCVIAIRIKATSEAIERAAEVAERFGETAGTRGPAEVTRRQIATAIRALSIPGGEG